MYWPHTSLQWVGAERRVTKIGFLNRGSETRSFPVRLQDALIPACVLMNAVALRVSMQGRILRENMIQAPRSNFWVLGLSLTHAPNWSTSWTEAIIRFSLFTRRESRFWPRGSRLVWPRAFSKNSRGEEMWSSCVRNMLWSISAISAFPGILTAPLHAQNALSHVPCFTLFWSAMHLHTLQRWRSWWRWRTRMVTGKCRRPSWRLWRTDGSANTWISSRSSAPWTHTPQIARAPSLLRVSCVKLTQV